MDSILSQNYIYNPILPVLFLKRIKYWVTTNFLSLTHKASGRVESDQATASDRVTVSDRILVSHRLVSNQATASDRVTVSDRILVSHRLVSNQVTASDRVTVSDRILVSHRLVSNQATASDRVVVSEQEQAVSCRTTISDQAEVSEQLTSPKHDPTDLGDVEDALNRYGNAILRLAYSYLHNMSDAEDILQDTLIKYMEAGQTFESDAHQKAWLLRVAANLSKNRIDYNRIRQTDELEETLAMDEREDLSFVWDAVKKLPEKYREVIHLFYHEGYQTNEISKILRRNESSVRSDLRRGREKLKEVLGKEYDFEI